MTDITTVLIGVIALLIGVATAFIIPFIKSRFTSAQWDNLMKWASSGVKAAECLIKGVSGLGGERREYVMKYLRELCEKYGYTFDDTILRIALENAWFDMTGGKREIKTTEDKAEISG